MIVVADASAVAAFLLPDEAGAFADFAREACTNCEVQVPQHWTAELANVIWKARRRKRIGDADLLRVADATAALVGAVTIHVEADITNLISAAIKTGLTSYDASYLLLAQALDAPILTQDGPLARAASVAGVRVIQP